MLQLDMFTDYERSITKLELDEVKAIVLDTKQSSDRVRKGMFARHGELFKVIMDLSQRLEILERNICQK